MKISELKSPYKEMALANQKLRGNELDKDRGLRNWFVWGRTKEGWDFWNEVEEGRLPELTPAIKANYPDIFPVAESPVNYARNMAQKQMESKSEGKKVKEESYTIADVEKAFKHCYQTGKVHPGNNMNKDWEAYKKTLI